MRVLALVIVIAKPIGALDGVVVEMDCLVGLTFIADSMIERGHHFVAHTFVLLHRLFCLLIGLSNR